MTRTQTLLTAMWQVFTCKDYARIHERHITSEDAGLTIIHNLYIDSSTAAPFCFLPFSLLSLSVFNRCTSLYLPGLYRFSFELMSWLDYGRRPTNGRAMVV